MAGIVASTRARLVEKVSAFKRVLGAVELSAALEQNQFLADAYVVLLEANPGTNQLITSVEQMTTRRLAVIFKLRYANDATGEKLADELEARIDEVHVALLGFQPGAEYSPLVSAGGRLLQFLPSTVIWTEEFTTSYLLRSS